MPTHTRLIHSIHSLTQPFSFTDKLALTQLFPHSFIHSLNHLLIQILTQPFTHPITLTHSKADSFTD